MLCVVHQDSHPGDKKVWAEGAALPNARGLSVRFRESTMLPDSKAGGCIQHADCCKKIFRDAKSLQCVEKPVVRKFIEGFVPVAEYEVEFVFLGGR